MFLNHFDILILKMIFKNKINMGTKSNLKNNRNNTAKQA